MARTNLSALKLPFGGEFSPSMSKKSDVTILFVPFFGGTKKSLNRHRDFVNELGFDCVVFDLLTEPNDILKSLFTTELEFGMKKVWTKQIERMLNEIPGEKIIYAFSNPSASAIEAIVRRQAYDIKGLICDGGPSGDFVKSLQSYYTEITAVPTLPLKMLAALVTTLTWSLDYKTAIFEDLQSVPKGFQILTIQGWKDKLITPAQIDKVFGPHAQIDWQKLALPEAGHLNGLKDFGPEYKPAVERFLRGL